MSLHLVDYQIITPNNPNYCQVSTMESAMSGSLSGVEGLTALEDQEEVRKVERQLKQRFPIGSQVSLLATN